MPKLTEPQRQKIRNIVLELYLLKVRKAPDIMQYLAEKEHITLGERQIAYYIAECREEIKRSSKVNRDEQLGIAIHRLEDLYRKCLSAEKYQTALGVVREISETLGLKAPAEMKHSASQTLEDWLKGEQAKWPDAPLQAKGKRSPGGADAEGVPETHH